MNIVVHGNWQVSQLVNRLAFSLLEIADVIGVDINNAQAS